MAPPDSRALSSRARALRWLRPRPSEWLALAFLILLEGVQLAVHAPRRYHLPRVDVILLAVGAMAIKLAVDYVRTPWPSRGSRLARYFPPTLLLVLAPALVNIAARLSEIAERWPDEYDNGGVAGTILWAVRSAMLGCLLGMAPLLLWCALGLHLKRARALALGTFAGRAALATLERVRAFAPPLLVILSYAQIGDLLQHPLFPDRDGLMKAADQLLFFGHDPLRLLEAMITPALSEWLAFAYTFYVFMLPLTFTGVLLAQGGRGLGEASFAITLGCGAGFLLYLLVPVRGPLFAEDFTVPLTYYYMGGVKQALLDRFRVPRDCFPSLHTAISLLCLWQCWRHARAVAWLILPMALSMPFACVYLRYHYLADVLAGMALAALVALLTLRFARAPAPAPPVAGEAPSPSPSPGA